MRTRLRTLLGCLGLIGGCFAVPAAAAPDPGGAIVVSAGGATLGYTTRVAVATAGLPVTFYDLDQLSHTVTSVDRDSDGRPLFEASAGPGSTSLVVGTQNLADGSYAFFCSFHPNMQGTLVVQGNGGGVKPSPPRFQLPLRIPRQLTGASITLDAVQADVQILPGRPKTTMMTYGGSWPGPTIRRPVGALTRVTVRNRLPETFGETSLHLHGGHQSSADDGQPMAYLIAPGRQKTYTYAFREGGRPQNALFSFYHDHRMDLTGRNNWYGLQGMVITDDPHEAALRLPSGRYDVPLLVADRSFDEAGQLTNPFPKPTDPNTVTSGFTGPYAPPGDATTGSRTLVNGEFQPYFVVATHRYRLRIVNASPFTTYDFALSDGRPFVEVGDGSSLLPAPVRRTDLLLGPAERADVVVDFGDAYGRDVVLQSIARSDERPGGIGSPLTPVMQFRVRTGTSDTSRVPAVLKPLPPLAVPTLPTETIDVALLVDPTGLRTTWGINGRAYAPGRDDLTVPLGSVARWRLVNTSTITHYIHLHEEAWRTLSRNGLPPPPWEAGFQDVWRLDPGDVVEVAAPITDYLGEFMIHCHMLDHEDHGMMATFRVVRPGARLLPARAPAGRAPEPRARTLEQVLAQAAWCRSGVRA